MVTRRHVRNLVGINLLIAGAGLVSTAQIAWVFGATRQSDLWFAASSIQASMLGMMQTGQLSEAFLPEYVRIRAERGRERAQECFSAVFNWACLIALALTVLAAALSPWICGFVGAGFSADQQAEIRWIFLWLLPLVPLQVVAGLQQMLGNAEGKFGRFEAPLLIGSLASILAVYLLGNRLGLTALVIAQWLLFLVSFAGRSWMLQSHGYRHRWRLGAEGFSPRGVFGQLGITFLYVAVTHAYLMIFRRALGLLPAGMMSAFSYAETLFSRISSLFMRPVSTVFFTSISERVSDDTYSRRHVVRSALARYLEMHLLLLALFLPGLAIFVAALWGGPRFGPDHIARTSLALGAMLVALLPQAQFMVSRKLNISHGFLRDQYWAMILNQCLMAAVCYPLVAAFGFEGAVAVSLFNVAGFCLFSLAATKLRMPDMVVVFRARDLLVAAGVLAPALAAGSLVLEVTESLTRLALGPWTGKLLAFTRFGLIAAGSLGTLWLMRRLALARGLIDSHDYA